MSTLNNQPDLKAESLRLYDLCSSQDKVARDRGYSELLDRLKRGARGLASHYGSPGADYPSEESCANTLTRILEHLSQCRDAQCFLAWCMQILRHEYWSVQEREVRQERHAPIGNAPPWPQVVKVGPVNRGSIDALREGEPQNPPEEVIGDPSVDTYQEIATHDWIHWVLQRIIDSPHASDRSKHVLIKGYLCELDDEELAQELRTTRKNITVIRARDRASMRVGEPDLMAWLRSPTM